MYVIKWNVISDLSRRILSPVQKVCKAIKTALCYTWCQTSVNCSRSFKISLQSLYRNTYCNKKTVPVPVICIIHSVMQNMYHINYSCEHFIQNHSNLYKSEELSEHCLTYEILPQIFTYYICETCITYINMMCFTKQSTI